MQAAVGLREGCLQLGSETAHVVRDSLRRDAGARAADDVEKLGAASGRRRGAERLAVFEGCVDVDRVRQLRAFRQYTDDGVRGPADRYRPPEHAGVAAEYALPEPVVEDRVVAASGAMLLVRESASERDPKPEHLQQSVAHSAAAYLLRIPRAEQREHAGRIGLDLFEDAVAFAHAHEIRRRQRRVDGAVGIEHAW